MPKLTLWKGAGVRTKDYQLIDRQVAEQFSIGGTEFWIHKYLGPVSQTGSTDATKPNTATTSVVISELVIQDVLNMEIRDRNYDPDIYIMKGHHAVSDQEFDLRQFGLFLSNDTVFITFHLNTMLDQIGRKLMSGDVIEIVHMRDDSVLGQENAVSKFYVVDEGVRPAEGYSQTWHPHIWRVKCSPMPDSQEFKQILNLPATDINGDPIPSNNASGNVTTLSDLLSTYNQELAISDAIVAQAEAEVPFRNFQGAHYYVLSGDLDVPVSIWAGDGIPPNGSKPVANGETFPLNPNVGDYFLRTDYYPSVLYQRKQNKWSRVEINYRQPWLPANESLATFINNTNTNTMTDGTVVPEQQNPRTAVKAKLDPDII